jgi:hypothetical protein
VGLHADLDCTGWEGTEVTPQIRTLIEDHHLGAILLTTKNLKSIDLSLLFLLRSSPPG